MFVFCSYLYIVDSYQPMAALFLTYVSNKVCMYVKCKEIFRLPLTLVKFEVPLTVQLVMFLVDFHIFQELIFAIFFFSI